MATGGDILEITFNHQSLGMLVLFVKSAEDSTFDLGGFRSTDDANMIAGNGIMIDQINRVRPSIEVTGVWDMNEADELSRLGQYAGHPVKSKISISHVNGTVWGLEGKPVGDLQGNGNASTMTLKLAGSKEIKKIVG